MAFTNTTYNNTVDSVLNTMKQTLNNPYYKWSDKPPTPVEYYNINKEKSTLDEGSQLVYSDTGDDSPLVYNKINNMLIYGLDQASLQLSNEEFGIESSAIESEAIILPNTIIPYVGDRFIITYTNHKNVFKVTEVHEDTLENGSNIYKISFRSSTSSYESVADNTAETYEMMIQNVGTSFNPIVRSEIYDLIAEMESLLRQLKIYYKELFYRPRVQTLVFKYLEVYFYDPYVVEFIRNNKLLDGDDEYIYINHQLPLPATFSIKYASTFFHALETKNLCCDTGFDTAIGKYIDHPNSIFEYRLEEYYEITYGKLYKTQGIIPSIPCFDAELFARIKSNKVFTGKNSFYNIIIKYMNNEDITIGDIKVVFKQLMYGDMTSFMFYATPCIIYCLERIIQDMITIQK